MERNDTSSSFQLSPSENQIITKAIQGIFFIGFLPNLFPGIGLPIEKRSKLYQRFRDCLSPKVSCDDKFNQKISQYQQLALLVKNLLGLMNLQMFSSIVLTKHLGDFLAALIQITYSQVLVQDTIKVIIMNSNLNSKQYTYVYYRDNN